MNTAKIAIFGSSEEFIGELRNYAEGAGLQVCAQTTNGNAAVELIGATKPDAAIIDLVLSGLDGFGVLDYVKHACSDCKAIVVSSIADDKTVSAAIARGANYFFAKPVTPENVVSRIKDITTGVSAPVKEKKKGINLDERISSIFMAIGVPPQIRGYRYMREGIKMTVAEPSIINRVTKELYPRIAEIYQTTPSKVERAIRHAIEVAWNRGRTEAISAVFGARVYIGSERPTNSEFIALVADKLMLETLE